MFVDLESGKIVAKFPVGPITHNLFCICDSKVRKNVSMRNNLLTYEQIAFASGTSVLVYDWSTGRQITKWQVKGLFDESKYKRHHREMKVKDLSILFSASNCCYHI